MNLDLKGKVALVTGSTSGIGKAIAMSLATEGASVILNGRHEDKVKQTIHDIHAVHPDAESLPWRISERRRVVIRSGKRSSR